MTQSSPTEKFVRGFSPLYVCACSVGGIFSNPASRRRRMPTYIRMTGTRMTAATTTSAMTGTPPAAADGTSVSPSGLERGLEGSSLLSTSLPSAPASNGCGVNDGEEDSTGPTYGVGVGSERGSSNGVGVAIISTVVGSGVFTSGSVTVSSLFPVPDVSSVVSELPPELGRGVGETEVFDENTSNNPRLKKFGVRFVETIAGAAVVGGTNDTETIKMKTNAVAGTMVKDVVVSRVMKFLFRLTAERLMEKGRIES